MTVNDSSILSFKRETTAGTSLITAVDSVTSYFGGYTEKTKEMSPPTQENEVKEYYHQDSRKPILQVGNKKNNTFTTMYAPNSSLPDYQFLGYGDTGTPATTTLRDTGKKDAYTIRHQETGGTTQLFQAVGCYNIGIKGKVEMNTDEEITQTWIYQSLEDDGDRSALTTMPTYPEGIESVYSGKPKVTWAGADLPEVWKVEWEQNQDYTTIETGGAYTINLHEYKPVMLKLTGILGSNTQWNAMADDTVIDITVRVYKQNDLTKYKDIVFNDCIVRTYIKAGKILEGAYLTTITLMCEDYSTSFVNEFAGNFANWFVNGEP